MEKWNVEIRNDLYQEAGMEANANGQTIDQFIESLIEGYFASKKETEYFNKKTLSKIDEKALNAGIRYLEQRGYTILESQYRFDGRYIDIVALDGETICFVVVSHSDGAGVSMDINPEAIRSYLEAISSGYLAEHASEIEPTDIRFDHIHMVIVSDDRAMLKHHHGFLREAA